MDLQTISQLLITNNIVNSTLSANTTAMYAVNWMHGATFDFNKKQVQTHRARLRHIGIDIALPCDLTRFSFVQPVNVRTVQVQELHVPDWYQLPRAA